MHEGSSREPTIRQRRVAELIAGELGLALQQRAQDPRLAGAVITGVQVSRDLRQATVYVTSTNLEEHRETLQALKHSASFLRRHLAQRTYLKFVPELRFRIDDTFDRAQRIESLLGQVAGEAEEPDDA